jgi:hypothetical protein
MACTPPDGMVLVTNTTGCVISVVICVPYMPPAHTITGDCPPDLDRRELLLDLFCSKGDKGRSVCICMYLLTYNPKLLLQYYNFSGILGLASTVSRLHF